jgi:hypothetical protein
MLGQVSQNLRARAKGIMATLKAMSHVIMCNETDICIRIKHVIKNTSYFY